MVGKKEHNWARFYNPRNGRISIQACSTCGIAKSIIGESHECSAVSSKVKESRLRGWSTEHRTQLQTVYSLAS